MRPTADVIAISFLVSAALMSSAGAQPRFGGGGGGLHLGGGGGGGFHLGGGGGGGFHLGGGGGFHPGGGGAASFVAPQISSPHFAPPQRLSAPHIAMPGAHVASPQRGWSASSPPHGASRNFIAPHTAAHWERINQSATRQLSPAGKRDLAQHFTPNDRGTLARHNATWPLSHVAPNAAASKAGQKPSGSRSALIGAPKGRSGETAAKDTAAKNTRQFTNRRQLTLNTAQTQHLQMHYVGGSPILRNTRLANLSSHEAEMRSLAQSTFRGNFSQSNWGRDWRRHHHNELFGFVLGLVGPVFWPYAYDDCIDYVLWPYAYDTFWPYAYDDVFEGIYGSYAPQYYAPEDTYAFAGAPASSAVYSSATGTSRHSAALPGGSQICSGQAQGLTDFPIERIAEQVKPDQHQQALLDALKAATAKAVDILQAACPDALPSTPIGRLAAMRNRVEAMVQAVQVVRPALEAFYSALSDEQKERFNVVDRNVDSTRGQPDLDSLCNKSQGKALPVARIEQSLHLTGGQDSALKELNDASGKAADILQASCQDEQSFTPTARVAAIEDRLKAVLRALDAFEPALTKFYDSLSEQQKARFDRLIVRPA